MIRHQNLQRCRRSVGRPPELTLSWKSGCASVIGQSHIDRDKPCQDSSAIRSLEAKNGAEILIACVSDGAGSAAYSDEGSRIVCQTFVEMVTKIVQADPDLLWRQEFFECWHQTCMAEMEQVASSLKTTVKQLAATALFAVIGKNRSMFFQIGDGGIVVSSPEDRADGAYYSWVFWPDKGEEYDNLTTFVTTKDAMKTAEGCLCDIEIDQLAMFSDGIEHAALVDKSQSAHQPFFRKCYKYFLEAVSREERDTAIGRVLKSPSLATVSDDDKSLVLAVRDNGG